MRLLNRKRLLTGTADDMRVVVDHPAKQPVAIGLVFGGVENVLMPELIQVVVAFQIGPRHQHESGLLA